MKFIIIFFLLLFKINYAFAYVGPGMAGGVIAAVIGFCCYCSWHLCYSLLSNKKNFIQKKKKKDE